MNLNRRTFLKGSGLAALSRGIVSAAPRPNIVIFLTDHTFSDSLSCRIGSRYLHTPAMDSLAAQGMVFSRAYCANPLCMPSRTSIFTGRYPVETKIEENGGFGGGMIGGRGGAAGGPPPPEARQPGSIDPAQFPLMGTIFKRAGYETVYTGKWHIPMDTAEPTSGFRTHAVSAGGRGPERPKQEPPEAPPQEGG